MCQRAFPQQMDRWIHPTTFLSTRGCQVFENILWSFILTCLFHFTIFLQLFCMYIYIYIYMRSFPAGAWLRTLSSAAVFSDSKMTQRACGGIEGRSFVSRSPQAHVFTLGPSHLMSQSRTPGIKNCGRINISHNVRVTGKGGDSHCVYWVI